MSRHRTQPYRVILYRDRTLKWRYKIIAGNHRQCGNPGQGFTRAHARRRAINAVPSEVLTENGGPGYTIEG